MPDVKCKKRIIKYPKTFMEFWKQYPNKGSGNNEKYRAYKIWRWNSSKIVSLDRWEILRILPEQIRSEKFNFPYPTAYLNQERWKNT